MRSIGVGQRSPVWSLYMTTTPTMFWAIRLLCPVRVTEAFTGSDGPVLIALIGEFTGGRTERHLIFSEICRKQQQVDKN